jgi:hypothetical protein
MMMTSGPCALVIGNSSYNEVYVVIYACEWVQVVSIRILWRFGGKQRIVMANFKIRELQWRFTKPEKF